MGAIPYPSGRFFLRRSGEAVNAPVLARVSRGRAVGGNVVGGIPPPNPLVIRG